jgi:hypothetical protein
MTDIQAKASLRPETVNASLSLGDAELVLTYKRYDEAATADAVFLVESAEEAFTKVLEALVVAAEEKETEG